MDYKEITEIMEKAKAKVIQKADYNATFADYANKVFNQGVTAMFQQAVFEVAMAFREKEG